MRVLLDEDVNPYVANIARGLGLDARSVHELGRQKLSDDEQLRFAATKERTIVTRNRDDFIRLTVTFFGTGEIHYGVLIIPYSLPNNRPERIAHALKRWLEKHSEHGSLGRTFVDFLSP